MRYVLWIDDIREVPSMYKDDHVLIARNYWEALWWFADDRISIDIIDFDHDLGEEKSGYDIAKFLVNVNYPKFNFRVHSMNPVGAANIRQLLTHYGYSEI